MHRNVPEKGAEGESARPFADCEAETVLTQPVQWVPARKPKLLSASEAATRLPALVLVHCAET